MQRHIKGMNEMSFITIATIATFIVMLIVMYRFASFAQRTFDAYELKQSNARRNITNYTGHHYNRHGNQIDWL